MRLNPDCIRDILLTIEEISDFNSGWSYNTQKHCTSILNKYTYEEVLYHVSQSKRSGLIEGVKFYDGGSSFWVEDLSPSGHEFLANIRSDTLWDKVKNISSEVGSKSLNTMIQIASAVVTEIIKAQLRLT